MSPYAFTNRYSLEVDPTIYERHRSHDYVQPAPAGEPPAPVVHLDLENLDAGATGKIEMLADTGARVSTLCGQSATQLQINRRTRWFNDLMLLSGIGGTPVVGLRREVNVYLGETPDPITVAVEPDSMTMRCLEQLWDEHVVPVVHDVLGRMDVIEQYLLCFDSERLYAFPKKE
jgi:hypothetical protein